MDELEAVITESRRRIAALHGAHPFDREILAQIDRLLLVLAEMATDRRQLRARVDELEQAAFAVDEDEEADAIEAAETVRRQAERIVELEGEARRFRTALKLIMYAPITPLPDGLSASDFAIRVLEKQGT